jgi:two-component system, LuxR family, response regulator FixJ
MRPLATRSHKLAPASGVVTIVNDDYAIDGSTTSLLERAGHKVVTFGSIDAFLLGHRPGDPGCVLLDIQTPGVDGLRVLRALASRDSMPPVLVLSNHGDIYQAVEAMKLGAVDVLEKPCPPEALLAAIAHAGAIGPRRKASAIDHEAAAKIASLSQRQRQVLQGVLKGKLNKIIAYEIGISVRTVEAYRAQLLTKLSVRGTAEAVRLGLAAGML